MRSPALLRVRTRPGSYRARCADRTSGIGKEKTRFFARASGIIRRPGRAWQLPATIKDPAAQGKGRMDATCYRLLLALLLKVCLLATVLTFNRPLTHSYPTLLIANAQRLGAASSLTTYTYLLTLGVTHGSPSCRCPMGHDFEGSSMRVFQPGQDKSTISSKDLKTELRSQFCRMSLPNVSWPLSSDGGGGSGISVMLLGRLERGGRHANPGSDRVVGLPDVGGLQLNRDLIKMELHALCRQAGSACSPPHPSSDRLNRTDRSIGRGHLTGRSKPGPYSQITRRTAIVGLG